MFKPVTITRRLRTMIHQESLTCKMATNIGLLRTEYVPTYCDAVGGKKKQSIYRKFLPPSAGVHATRPTTLAPEIKGSTSQSGSLTRGLNTDRVDFQGSQPSRAYHRNPMACSRPGTNSQLVTVSREAYTL